MGVLVTIDSEDSKLKMYRVRVAAGQEAVSVAFHPVVGSPERREGVSMCEDTEVEWSVMFEGSLGTKVPVVLGRVARTKDGFWRFLIRGDVGLVLSSLTLRAIVAFIEDVLPKVDLEG